MSDETPNTPSPEETPAVSAPEAPTTGGAVPGASPIVVEDLPPLKSDEPTPVKMSEVPVEESNLSAKTRAEMAAGRAKLAEYSQQKILLDSSRVEDSASTEAQNERATEAQNANKDL